LSGLLSFLIRQAPGLLISRELIRQAIRRLVATIAIYAVVATLAVISLAFLYVLLYDWLCDWFDGKSAAAIIIGGNLIVIGLILLVRTIVRRRNPPRKNVAQAVMEQVKPEVAIAAGMAIGRKMRKAAPKVAIAAGVIGLAIGFRPQLLGLFGAARKNNDDKPRR
jgi:hypothetical protein